MFRYFHLTISVVALALCSALASGLFATAPVHALTDPATDLGGQVGVTTVLGTQVDLDLVFKDQEGQERKLRQFLRSDRPTIVVPAYYHCPRLCGLVLAGMSTVINELGLKMGEDYRVLTVSLDHNDPTERAASIRKEQVEKLTFPERAAGDGWSFLTGDEGAVAALMGQLGFGFKKDGEEFAHSAAIMLLTPDGKISQYFTGINFAPGDLRLALVEASQGTIGSPLDHVLLFCFRFDPTKGKYTWAAWVTLRTGGALTLLLLGGFLITLWSRERFQSRAGSQAR
jgi:protein SCO1/2